MVVEWWGMRKEALVSHMQPVSSYFSFEKCKVDQSATTDSMHTRWKHSVKGVEPHHLSDGNTADGVLDWRGRSIRQVIQIPGH